MANKVHLRILKRGVDAWNKWRPHPRAREDLPSLEDMKHPFFRAMLILRPDVKEADLSKTDLSGAFLAEANLRKADLDGTNLAGANLSRADLSEAFLAGADLSGADLSEANLHGAYLREANLDRANLRKADLSSAVLSKARLREAQLYEADFNRASLHSVVLNKAQLYHANFEVSELTKANLNGAFCQGTNFTRARLVESESSGADFTGANFTEAKLNKANFSQSVFAGANFTGATLISAKLTMTRLVGADLTNTELVGADLSDAKVGWLRLENTNLSRIIGLSTVHHVGPSTVSIDTLYRSEGKIPDNFLRGTGVPDEFIIYLRSLVFKPRSFYSCFITYSSKDQTFAEKLHTDLQDKGVRCWFAPEDFKIGDKLRPAIDESIRVYDKLLLILSEHSVASNWVEHEVETALAREAEQKRVMLFPIRLDDGVMGIKTGWPAHIHNTRYIGDFRNWKDRDAYKKAFALLLRDLKAESPEKL